MIDISEKNLDIVLDIIKDLVPNSEVRVFGLRYKGNAKPYSDLDLVIVSKEQLDWKIIPELKEAFQESDLPFRVNVLDQSNIENSFKTIILNSGYEIIFSGL